MENKNGKEERKKGISVFHRDSGYIDKKWSCLVSNKSLLQGHYQYNIILYYINFVWIFFSAIYRTKKYLLPCTPYSGGTVAPVKTMAKGGTKTGCGCIDDVRPSDSDEELRNSPAGQASRQEMSEILNRQVRRQEERLASTCRVQSSIEALNRDVEAFKRLDKSPPP